MTTTTTNDGVKLAHRVLGTGPRTVIAIHGWMMSGRVYNWVVPLLDLAGLRLVIPDLRGTGDSDKPETGYTIEAYARDILQLADQLDATSFTVIGHSMGGAIAQWLAAEVPARVDGAVLVCPVPASGVPLPPEHVQEVFRNAHLRTNQTAILGMACTNLTDADREHLLAAAATVTPACIREGYDAWTGASFADRLDAVSARTLVVASDDPFLTPEFLRQEITAKISGSRLVVIPGAGHYVQVERPRETAAVIEAFLAGLG